MLPSLITSFLSDYSGIPLEQLQPTLYQFSEEEAVRIVFRVASSLDSMILANTDPGTDEKSCYNHWPLTSKPLDIFKMAFFNRLLLRSQRAPPKRSIGEYTVSVSSAAVELRRKIFWRSAKEKHPDCRCRENGRGYGSNHHPTKN